MMGRRSADQQSLFYAFNLDEVVPNSTGSMIATGAATKPLLSRRMACRSWRGELLGPCFMVLSLECDECTGRLHCRWPLIL